MSPSVLWGVAVLCVLAGLPHLAASSALLSNQEVAEVLRAHNHYRRNVRPQAKNMAKMVSKTETGPELPTSGHLHTARAVAYISLCTLESEPEKIKQ